MSLIFSRNSGISRKSWWHVDQYYTSITDYKYFQLHYRVLPVVNEHIFLLIIFLIFFNIWRASYRSLYWHYIKSKTVYCHCLMYFSSTLCNTSPIFRMEILGIHENLEAKQTRDKLIKLLAMFFSWWVTL